MAQYFHFYILKTFLNLMPGLSVFPVFLSYKEIEIWMYFVRFSWSVKNKFTKTTFLKDFVFVDEQNILNMKMLIKISTYLAFF